MRLTFATSICEPAYLTLLLAVLLLLAEGGSAGAASPPAAAGKAPDEEASSGSTYGSAGRNHEMDAHTAKVMFETLRRLNPDLAPLRRDPQQALARRRSAALSSSPSAETPLGGGGGEGGDSSLFGVRTEGRDKAAPEVTGSFKTTRTRSRPTPSGAPPASSYERLKQLLGESELQKLALAGTAGIPHRQLVNSDEGTVQAGDTGSTDEQENHAHPYDRAGADGVRLRTIAREIEESSGKAGPISPTANQDSASSLLHVEEVYGDPVSPEEEWAVDEEPEAPQQDKITHPSALLEDALLYHLRGERKRPPSITPGSALQDIGEVPSIQQATTANPTSGERREGGTQTELPHASVDSTPTEDHPSETWGKGSATQQSRTTTPGSALVDQEDQVKASKAGPKLLLRKNRAHRLSGVTESALPPKESIANLLDSPPWLLPLVLIVGVGVASSLMTALCFLAIRGNNRTDQQPRPPAPGELTDAAHHGAFNNNNNNNNNNNASVMTKGARLRSVGHSKATHNKA